MLKAVFAFAVIIFLLALAAPEVAPKLLADLGLGRPSSPAADTSSPVRNDARVVLKADRAGHYRSQFSVNGMSLDGVVDTGATSVTLSYDDARRLGLVVPGDRFEVPVQTANGLTHVKRVRLNGVKLGSISLRDIDGLVAQPGQLSTNLLGMSFLGQLRRVEVSNRQLLLEK